MLREIPVDSVKDARARAALLTGIAEIEAMVICRRASRDAEAAILECMDDIGSCSERLLDVMRLDAERLSVSRLSEGRVRAHLLAERARSRASAAVTSLMAGFELYVGRIGSVSRPRHAGGGS